MLSSGVLAQDQSRVISSNAEVPANEMIGVATNGLKPVIQFVRQDKEWGIQIIFIGQTNFVRNNWLHITNQVGSKIRAWETNGVEIPLKDSSALAAWTLPVQTTVSNVMRGVVRSRRGMQWWPHGQDWSGDGKMDPAYYFILQSIFGVPLTNDITIELNPLIYKANTNNEEVHLIEFPTIRAKLKADGTVEKLE
jgi:hypothetical protein